MRTMNEDFHPEGKIPDGCLSITFITSLFPFHLSPVVFSPLYCAVLVSLALPLCSCYVLVLDTDT